MNPEEQEQRAEEEQKLKGCKICGCIVYDTERHDQWHEDRGDEQ